MKKAICMVALAAISYGTVYAAIPVNQQDTTKVKVKSKGDKTKIKKKMKDTTKNM
jgi:type IV secretory pathway component VirB8